jgi:hypothetical protein
LPSTPKDFPGIQFLVFSGATMTMSELSFLRILDGLCGGCDCGVDKTSLPKESRRRYYDDEEDDDDDDGLIRITSSSQSNSTESSSSEYMHHGVDKTSYSLDSDNESEATPPTTIGVPPIIMEDHHDTWYEQPQDTNGYEGEDENEVNLEKLDDSVAARAVAAILGAMEESQAKVDTLDDESEAEDEDEEEMDDHEASDDEDGDNEVERCNLVLESQQIDLAPIEALHSDEMDSIIETKMNSSIQDVAKNNNVRDDNIAADLALLTESRESAKLLGYGNHENAPLEESFVCGQETGGNGLEVDTFGSADGVDFWMAAEMNDRELSQQVITEAAREAILDQALWEIDSPAPVNAHQNHMNDGQVEACVESSELYTAATTEQKKLPDPETTSANIDKAETTTSTGCMGKESPSSTEQLILVSDEPVSEGVTPSEPSDLFNYLEKTILNQESITEASSSDDSFNTVGGMDGHAIATEEPGVSLILLAAGGLTEPTTATGEDAFDVNSSHGAVVTGTPLTESGQSEAKEANEVTKIQSSVCLDDSKHEQADEQCPVPVAIGKNDSDSICKVQPRDDIGLEVNRDEYRSEKDDVRDESSAYDEDNGNTIEGFANDEPTREGVQCEQSQGPEVFNLKASLRSLTKPGVSATVLVKPGKQDQITVPSPGRLAFWKKMEEQSGFKPVIFNPSPKSKSFQVAKEIRFATAPSPASSPSSVSRAPRAHSRALNSPRLQSVSALCSQFETLGKMESG